MGNRSKNLNGFNDGLSPGNGIGGKKSAEDEMGDIVFLERIESAIIVLRNLLKGMDLKLGQGVAEDILMEIKLKINKEEK